MFLTRDSARCLLAHPVGSGAEQEGEKIVQSRVSDVGPSPHPPSKAVGVASGIMATLGFMVIHDLWILDIWEMAGPMLVSGALSGLVIVWSYDAAVVEHSAARWVAYNGLIGLSLVLLGAASFVWLEPRFTMAEAMALGDDALSRLLPPAIPLMIGAALVDTVVLWTAFGRRRGALLPILVAQVPLIFFVGHQFAVLGVVELTDDLMVFYGEFIALTIYLAAAYAGAVLLLERMSRSLRPSIEQGEPAATPAERP